MKAPTTNLVQFSGNVAADPRGMAFKTGNAVVHIFCINNDVVDTRGGPKEISTAVAIDVFGTAAEIAALSRSRGGALVKGAAITVSGKLRLDVWGEGDAKRRELKIRASAADLVIHSAAPSADEEAADNAAVVTETTDLPF